MRIPRAIERLALKGRIERLCVKRAFGERALLKHWGTASEGLPRSVGPATLGS